MEFIEILFYYLFKNSQTLFKLFNIRASQFENLFSFYNTRIYKKFKILFDDSSFKLKSRRIKKLCTKNS